MNNHDLIAAFEAADEEEIVMIFVAMVFIIAVCTIAAVFAVGDW